MGPVPTPSQTPEPSASAEPTAEPTANPSIEPTDEPTAAPSEDAPTAVATPGETTGNQEAVASSPPKHSLAHTGAPLLTLLAVAFLLLVIGGIAMRATRKGKQ